MVQVHRPQYIVCRQGEANSSVRRGLVSIRNEMQPTVMDCKIKNPLI